MCKQTQRWGRQRTTIYAFLLPFSPSFVGRVFTKPMPFKETRRRPRICVSEGEKGQNEGSRWPPVFFPFPKRGEGEEKDDGRGWRRETWSVPSQTPECGKRWWWALTESLVVAHQAAVETPREGSWGAYEFWAHSDEKESSLLSSCLHVYKFSFHLQLPLQLFFLLWRPGAVPCYYSLHTTFETSYNNTEPHRLWYTCFP